MYTSRNIFICFGFIKVIWDSLCLLKHSALNEKEISFIFHVKVALIRNSDNDLFHIHIWPILISEIVHSLRYIYGMLTVLVNSRLYDWN